MPQEKLQETQKEKCLEIINDWISKQTNLPMNIDNNFIKRFLHCCEYDMENTKALINMCFKTRFQSPELFNNRDVASKELQNVFKITDMIPLPKLSKENYKIFIYRLADYDPNKYTFSDAVKTFLAVADVRLVWDPQFPDGEVPIFDMKGFSLRHIAKTSLPILKKYMYYTQEVHPVRLKQIHVLNVPSFLDKVLTIIKPFMKRQVADMIHFHLPDSSSIYNHIPRDLLPEEYGGNCGNIQQHKEEWMKRIMEYRHYLVDETRWNKRQQVENNENLSLGIKESFKHLSID